MFVFVVLWYSGKQRENYHPSNIYFGLKKVQVYFNLLILDYAEIPK